MSYVALSRVKSLGGLNILAIKDSNILTLKPKKAPCDDDAVRELHRLRLMKIGISEDEEMENILSWLLDYPMCNSCKQWVCYCKCV